jgi:uncharacterized membrane protein (UPF0127 family)
MNKILYLFIFILAVSSSLFLINRQNKPMILINNSIAVNIELAETQSVQAKGLSGREGLAENNGMLFIYSNYALRSFWMKNMNFPIDIIWIRDDKIAGFNENLQPEGDSPTNKYQSPVPVNYVLEVPAGFIKKHGIRVGDMVELKN